LSNHLNIGRYTPEDTSWSTSTYLLLTFFFAACDRDRPMGGGFGMLLFFMFVIGGCLGVAGFIYYPNMKSLIGRGGDSDGSGPSQIGDTSITYTNQRNEGEATIA